MSWSDRRYQAETDHFRSSGFPVGTALIVGTTIGFSLLLWGFGGGSGSTLVRTAIDAGGLDVASLLKFQIWRLVTYGLLHGGTSHLVQNCLYCLLIGFFLEGMIGRNRLLKLYGSLLVASGLAVLLKPLILGPETAYIKTIGASGAIMGLIAFFAARFPDLRILFFGVVPVKAWVYAAILIATDLLALFARDSGGTDHIVHLGGAAAGVIYGWGWPRAQLKWERRQVLLRREKAGEEQRRSLEESAELDRILQKIKDEGGMHKLNERERKFLVDQSARLKGKSRS